MARPGGRVAETTAGGEEQVAPQAAPSSMPVSTAAKVRAASLTALDGTGVLAGSAGAGRGPLRMVFACVRADRGPQARRVSTSSSRQDRRKAGTGGLLVFRRRKREEGLAVPRI